MSYDTDESRLARLIRPFVAPSVDILIGLGLAVGAMIASVTTTGPLRILAGLPLVFFLPGYALVSAVFPSAPEQPVDSSLNGRLRRVEALSPGYGMRAVLGFGLSVALLPLVGLVLGTSGLGFTPLIVAGSLSLLTAFGLLLAGYRRSHLPENRRFHVPVREWGRGLYAGIFHQRSLIDSVLNLAVLLGVVVALSVLLYAVVATPSVASFSSFSILSESDSGEFIAANYSGTLVEGEGENIVLEVENHEREMTEYTVVAELQRFDQTSGTVTARSQLRRFSESVGPGQIWRSQFSVQPEMTGENLRLMFYLYTDSVPDQPTVDSADEHVFIWVDVVEPGSPAATANESAGETPTPAPTPTPTPAPSVSSIATPNAPPADGTNTTLTATPNVTAAGASTPNGTSTPAE